MQETEVKFYIEDLERIRSRLAELGFHRIQQRVLERNIRFDLPRAALRAEGRVLRLRQDTEARLTYKGASRNEQGVLSREEIEFVVEDFEKAKLFLEALGFQKLVYYEKFRTTYELAENCVMLDELPYGDFVEIEGDTIESIRALAQQLQLNWDRAVGTSYHELFEQLRRALNLSISDLSFANFADIPLRGGVPGVRAADSPT